VRHPAAQRLRRHVHQFDLFGRPDHGVGHRFPLWHAGDLLDHVVERLQVLDVDGGDDVDARPQQFLHVLPALLVAGAGHVGVRQLVHERDLRLAGEHRVDVHLLEEGAAVGQPGPGDHLQALDQLGGVLTPVRFHEADDHVGAALGAPVPLAEHGVGLADARGVAEVDPELPRVGTAHRLPRIRCLLIPVCRGGRARR